MKARNKYCGCLVTHALTLTYIYIYIYIGLQGLHGCFLLAYQDVMWRKSRLICCHGNLLGCARCLAKNGGRARQHLFRIMVFWPTSYDPSHHIYIHTRALPSFCMDVHACACQLCNFGNILWTNSLHLKHIPEASVWRCFKIQSYLGMDKEHRGYTPSNETCWLMMERGPCNPMCIYIYIDIGLQPNSPNCCTL